jgi:hypothetical protein
MLVLGVQGRSDEANVITYKKPTIQVFNSILDVCPMGWNLCSKPKGDGEQQRNPRVSLWLQQPHLPYISTIPIVPIAYAVVNTFVFCSQLDSYNSEEQGWQS